MPEVETVRAQTAASVHAAVAKLANAERAKQMQRYFKTGPGEYAEGDVFAGMPVPVSRGIAREFPDMPATELDILIQSSVHEERLIALVIQTAQFKRSRVNIEERRTIFAAYDSWLRRGRINNWDLVDVSAPHIGAYIFEALSSTEANSYLTGLSKSDNLWLRRASVIFTFAALSIGDTKPSLSACERLIADQHELIHKAVGWVLREVGKREPETLRAFLAVHAPTMPRTALRYAIEKFDGPERQHWLGARTASSQLK